MIQAEKRFKGKCREILALWEQHEKDPAHSLHVSRLSRILFEELRPLHRLSARYRFYLEMAALLHDIGESVSKNQHHKHSFRLISEADIPSLKTAEQVFISVLARYHRKSLPRPGHYAMDIIPEKERRPLSMLAAILRIADGLDKTHRQTVAGARLVRTGGEITFLLHGDSISDEDIQGARKKSELFEVVFGRTITFIR